MKILFCILFLFASVSSYAQDQSQLQALIDDACDNHSTLRLDGEYTISGTVYIRCLSDPFGFSMDASGARFNVTDGSIAAVVVDSLQDSRVLLPEVLNIDPDGTGNGEWKPYGIGVQLKNVRSSHIETGKIQNFYHGLMLTGAGGAVVYNNVFIRHLANNRSNLTLVTWSEGSWVNQNNFYGGKYLHWSNEGVDLSGVKHVYLWDNTPNDGVGAPNNNTWFGASFEGQTAYYSAEITGNYNTFYNCRWEHNVSGQGLRVLFNAGQNLAINNLIHYGYGAERIQVYGNTTQNEVVYRQ